jgi:hypothetical protein
MYGNSKQFLQACLLEWGSHPTGVQSQAMQHEITGCVPFVRSGKFDSNWSSRHEGNR